MSKMNIGVCTLFEGHYHFGLAALCNSLYKNGFRGVVYAGYRGELPKWASEFTNNTDLEWPGAKKMIIGDGIFIHFLPVESKVHFTNYKADFMLRLWEYPAKKSDGLLYFDPDIVVRCKWDFYEKWITHGVALVHEITSNDMPVTHPIRKEWQKIIESNNMTLTNKVTSYINAGFLGVSKDNIEFLHVLSNIMHIAEKDFNFEKEKFNFSNRTELFFAGDQDALNIAAMCSKSPLSEIGPEGMDFIYGGFTMSHAIGSPKPWKKNFILSVLKGNPPSKADKEFWLNFTSPIKCYSNGRVKFKKITISVAALIGRFYKRS